MGIFRRSWPNLKPIGDRLDRFLLEDCPSFLPGLEPRGIEDSLLEIEGRDWKPKPRPDSRSHN